MKKAGFKIEDTKGVCRECVYRAVIHYLLHEVAAGNLELIVKGGRVLVDFDDLVREGAHLFAFGQAFIRFGEVEVDERGGVHLRIGGKRVCEGEWEGVSVASCDEMEKVDSSEAVKRYIS